MKQVGVGSIFKMKNGCRCKVVRYENSSNIEIEFDDHFRFRKITSKTHLLNGEVKNPYFPNVYGIGFIGSGKYVGRENGKVTKSYQVWLDLLRRCYSKKYQETHLAYKGCTVCEEWHNFQNFAEWYINNKYYGLGYELDKDLLMKDNRLYSPETCCLVPRKINTGLQTKKERNNLLPSGVSLYGNGKYLCSLSLGEDAMFIKVFDNIGEAKKEYVKQKERYIKLLAEDWRYKIEPRAYQALMVWTVS